MAVIELAGVSKTFSRVTGRTLLRGHLKNWFHGAHKSRFYALRHVSFHVDGGESVAVVGSNGAGKSTLLGLIAGLTTPDEGTVWVDGTVAGLMELGTGFHPELTGAENARLNAALLGFSRKRINEAFDEIVDFAGVRDFINEPLRTYSSGMVLRLAFSVALSMDPDILLVDEVLAVGDQTFQAKCLGRIKDLRRKGKTMICVSHAVAMLQEFCERAIWLDHGELVASGPVAEVIGAYTGKTTA